MKRTSRKPQEERRAGSRTGRGPGSPRGRGDRPAPRGTEARGTGRGFVTIDALNDEGDGIGEVDGRQVEVPATLPGERAEIEWRTLRDGRRVAQVLRLIESSPHRVTPGCRHFGPCGGCTWQHIAYKEQLRLKQQRLQALLDASLGRGAAHVLPTIGTPRRPEPPEPPESRPVDPDRPVREGGPDPDAPWQFRNKVHFVFGPGRQGEPLIMGHYRRGSRTIVPVEECPVHAEPGNRLAFTMRDVLSRAGIPGSTPDGEEGIARHVVIRVGEGAPTQLVTLVVTENVKRLRAVSAKFLEAAGLPEASWRLAEAPLGLHLNVHDRPGSFLFGRETMRVAGANEVMQPVGGIRFIVGPTAFFQTNVQAAEVLVRQVIAAIPGGFTRVLDLYAGVGLFSLSVAALGFTSVRAVEENREAVQNAHETRRANRVAENRFMPWASPVEEAMERFTKGPSQDPWDVVILDPPRSGCPPVVLDWVYRTLRPGLIIYVSCNPEALARDLRGARWAGYRIRSVQPVDMFPHTAHLETVVVLERDPRADQRGSRRER